MVKLRQDGETSSKTGGDCLAISGCSRFKGYRRQRFVRVKVLKMISPRRLDSEGPAAGGGGGGGGGGKDDDNGTKAFLSTGRTGRRNALPDIHGKHATTSISDLPDRFGELSTEADHGMNVAARETNNQPGVSKQHVG